MRRWLLRIFVFLLLGAITNVAVAWGCVLWARSGDSVEFELSRAEAERMVLQRDVPVHLSDQPYGTGVRTTGLTMFNLALDAIHRDGLSLWSLITQAGLPCRSLTGEMGNRGTTTDEMYSPLEIEFGIEIPDSMRRSEAFNQGLLPTRPIWPGFAINTLLYAVIMWGGWLVVARTLVFLRRRRRIRRGLCPMCAYDLRGTKDATACPECGVARLGKERL